LSGGLQFLIIEDAIDAISALVQWRRSHPQSVFAIRTESSEVSCPMALTPMLAGGLAGDRRRELLGLLRLVWQYYSQAAHA